ncbi:hypothetical protein [Salinibacillus xinjiangensis]|nr:hypothetical protein [Salinibacillus xinjiangensis]
MGIGVHLTALPVIVAGMMPRVDGMIGRGREYEGKRRDYVDSQLE